MPLHDLEALRSVHKDCVKSLDKLRAAAHSYVGYSGDAEVDALTTRSGTALSNAVAYADEARLRIETLLREVSS
jgi:hypothetical protein